MKILSLLPVLFLVGSLLFYYFLKIPGSYTTDELLYISEPNLLYGPGVFLNQLYFNYVSPHPLINIIFVTLILAFSIRNFEQADFNLCLHERVVLILSVINPYLLYHASSFLKDSLIFAVLIYSVSLMYSRKSYVVAVSGFLLVCVLRNPMIIVLTVAFGLVWILKKVQPSQRLLICALFLVLMFLFLFYVVEATDIYVSLVSIFERERFSGLSLFNLERSEEFLYLYVFFNFLAIAVVGFFHENFSGMLFLSSLYWTVVYSYIFISITYQRLITILIFLFSWAPIYLVQVFPETAGRYFIIAPVVILMIQLLMKSRGEHKGQCRPYNAASS